MLRASSTFASDWCVKELQAFLKRQEQIGRDDLILPVYYLDCKYAKPAEAPQQQLIRHITLGQTQYIDWRALRHDAVDSKPVMLQLENMAEQLLEAIANRQ